MAWKRLTEKTKETARSQEERCGMQDVHAEVCLLPGCEHLNVHVGARLQEDEPPSLPTWVSFTHVQVVAAADAGGVQRVNAEGGDLAPELLDVAVFAVQRHLKLQTHLVLFCYQLNNRHEQPF